MVIMEGWVGRCCHKQYFLHLCPIFYCPLNLCALPSLLPLPTVLRLNPLHPVVLKCNQLLNVRIRKVNFPIMNNLNKQIKSRGFEYAAHELNWSSKTFFSPQVHKKNQRQFLHWMGCMSVLMAISRIEHTPSLPCTFSIKLWWNF